MTGWLRPKQSIKWVGKGGSQKPMEPTILTVPFKKN